MKTCPQCKRQFNDNIGFCAFDGQQLSLSNSEDKLIGHLIDSKYQIQEQVAKGGTGTVYRGTHLQLSMPIAIKIMHQEKNDDYVAVERFRREAYAAMQIRHPNALAIMDFGVTPDNLVYVIMEYLQGQTLRDYLKENRYPPLAAVNDIMQQICGAVAVAHKRKIVHRDLKPENILLHKDPDGEVVKVLDFGIVKFKGAQDQEGLQLTRQGIVVGTPYYMSPEQCYGKEIDTRSDIYSLGIMLYELLAGKLPFLGRSHTAIAVKQAKEIPRPIPEIRPDIPAILNDIVMYALQKLPANRPDTVQIFAHELDVVMRTILAGGTKKRRGGRVTSEISLAAIPKRLTAQFKKELTSDVETDLPPTTTELEGETLSSSDSMQSDSLADKSLTETSTQLNLLSETQERDSQQIFCNLSRETSMLLQIILGDIENSETVDPLFLNELKSAVDQLRSSIYQLQKVQLKAPVRVNVSN